MKKINVNIEMVKPMINPIDFVGRENLRKTFSKVENVEIDESPMATVTLINVCCGETSESS